MKFSKNDKIDFDGKTLLVKEVLGEGGQGTVYLVSYEGKDYALKIYKNEESADFFYNLRNNIRKGAPSSDFLWPLKYIELDDDTRGYLMDVRPKEYSSFVKYLNGNVEFKDRSTLLSWCIELCKSFKELHEKGFSYQDLNDGSFFLKEDTGELLICDNDNVTADRKNLGVLGKIRYMAPEIVAETKDERTGEGYMPDIHTDRFSLAIILFLAICKGNPFEGELLKKYDIIDEEAEKELFGTHPVFIYDKTDKSNKPIRGYHTAVINRWPLLPAYIKDAFDRTFTKGIADRENERTTELEWLRLLTKYRDELTLCSCGKEYPIGLYDKKVAKCPYCKSSKDNAFLLTVNHSRILLEPGKRLYLNHLDKYSKEYNQKAGEVIENKKHPGLYGIRLSWDKDVTIKDSKGTVKVIPQGGVIPVLNHLEVSFDAGTIGTITLKN